MNFRLLHAALLGSTLACAGNALAAKLYVTDSSGKPVIDGSGKCVMAAGGRNLDECGPAPAPVAREPAPLPVVPVTVAPPVPAMPTPAPAPEPVVLDRDRDGVSDDRDLCSNSVAGSMVDASGCVEKLVMHNIAFHYNSVELTRESKAVLDRLAAKVRLNPAIASVTIYGHTDSRGSYELNQRISEQRANAVRDYLASQGLAAERLRAIGKGEMEPLESNMLAPGRARNRRVEFEFTMK